MRRDLYKDIRTNGPIKRSSIPYKNSDKLGVFNKARDYKIIWTSRKHDSYIERYKTICRFCNTRLCNSPESQYNSFRTYYKKSQRKMKKRRRHLLRLKTNNINNSQTI